MRLDLTEARVQVSCSQDREEVGGDGKETDGRNWGE